MRLTGPARVEKRALILMLFTLLRRSHPESAIGVVRRLVMAGSLADDYDCYPRQLSKK